MKGKNSITWAQAVGSTKTNPYNVLGENPTMADCVHLVVTQLNRTVGHEGPFTSPEFDAAFAAQGITSPDQLLEAGVEYDPEIFRMATYDTGLVTQADGTKKTGWLENVTYLQVGGTTVSHDEVVSHILGAIVLSKKDQQSVAEPVVAETLGTIAPELIQAVEAVVAEEVAVVDDTAIEPVTEATVVGTATEVVAEEVVAEPTPEPVVEVVAEEVVTEPVTEPVVAADPGDEQPEPQPESAATIVAVTTTEPAVEVVDAKEALHLVPLKDQAKQIVAAILDKVAADNQAMMDANDIAMRVLQTANNAAKRNRDLLVQAGVIAEQHGLQDLTVKQLGE